MRRVAIFSRIPRFFLVNGSVEGVKIDKKGSWSEELSSGKDTKQCKISGK